MLVTRASGGGESMGWGWGINAHYCLLVSVVNGDTDGGVMDIVFTL